MVKAARNDDSVKNQKSPSAGIKSKKLFHLKTSGKASLIKISISLLPAVPTIKDELPEILGWELKRKKTRSATFRKYRAKMYSTEA